MFSTGVLCVWKSELSRPWSPLFSSLNTIKKHVDEGLYRVLFNACIRQSTRKWLFRSSLLDICTWVYIVKLIALPQSHNQPLHVWFQNMLNIISISLASFTTHLCLLWGDFRWERTRTMCCFVSSMKYWSAMSAASSVFLFSKFNQLCPMAAISSVYTQIANIAAPFACAPMRQGRLLLRAKESRR